MLHRKGAAKFDPKFGHRISKDTRVTTISAMTDTGCQSCLSGLGMLAKLNMKTSDLLPVKVKMNAANKKPINILGAAILNLTVRSEEGKSFSTKQLTYITNDTETFFLSKEACQDLQIIPRNFPSVLNLRNFGGHPSPSAAPSKNEHLTAAAQKYIPPDPAPATCSCPPREQPPPPPTKLPYPPTKENVPKLKQFLLDHYKASTFNVCEHQQLPLMNGPPLKLTIKDDARPVAYHTPLPVPLHWQE